MRLWKHVLLDAGALLLTLGLPFAATDGGRSLLSGNADAVSSASVIIEQPSGEYLVLLNLDRHPDAENLALWEQFFTGEDTPIIYEDITCLTIDSDTGGRTMADSFRSRLPEHQMEVHAADGTLLCSKADCGLFDVIVLSAEAAEAFGSETFAAQSNVRTLHITGESS